MWSRRESWTGFPILTLAVWLLGVLPLQAQDPEYNPRDKRDPFFDHTRVPAPPAQSSQQPPTPPLSRRPAGLSGLLISEVTVSGTASTSGSSIALLRGVDSFTYLAREGSRLYDGYLESISGDEVVFVRQTESSGGPQTQKVVKRFSTEQQ